MNITIIIPTYRPKEYLWECLASIDDQTLDHNAFEVLIVLNGEREPYEQEILSYLAAHPSLPARLIYNEVRGVSAARNRGLDEARGEYICFIDDDDLITPSYLEQLNDLASEDTIPLSYITAFEDGNLQSRSLTISHHYQNSSRLVRYTAVRRYFNVIYCKVIPRDVIGDRRFDETLQNGEDSLFMFLISDRFQWVRFTPPTAVYRYRKRPTSAFHTHRPLRYHLVNAFRRLYKSSKIYIAHPKDYNLLFYLKFLAATVAGCYRQYKC